jgi:NAD(P)-dependent dehydrogenase (short-subunit alcohol dehydrogenase family)
MRTGPDTLGMVGQTSFDYSGESAIVTGSTKGIGRGVAEALAEHGANVVINARTAEDVERVVDEMNETHEGEIVGAPGDLREPGSVERMVATGVDAFGTIDLLVNNAAMWPREESMVEATLDDWNQVMDVNVRSQFYAGKLVAEHMIDRGVEGNVINVTSQTGDRRCGGRGLYGASNTAINGLTWRMAYDYAQHGIRVNAVSTDVTETYQLRYEAELVAEDDPERSPEDVLRDWGERRPLGRLGQPEDLGNAVLFLASEQASYIVGTILRVSGGGNLQGDA